MHLGFLYTLTSVYSNATRARGIQNIKNTKCATIMTSSCTYTTKGAYAYIHSHTHSPTRAYTTSIWIYKWTASGRWGIYSTKGHTRIHQQNIYQKKVHMLEVCIDQTERAYTNTNKCMHMYVCMYPTMYATYIACITLCIYKCICNTMHAPNKMHIPTYIQSFMYKYHQNWT